ncbi:MAG TPA: PadR family transcriptional regulator [Dehalococcoidia bacterium]|nr:PadR family transcriptional regulator [Dehalococcoidia bacterium]
MLREFFLGFIGIHILYHAGKEPVYGIGLMNELRRHGYNLSPGTLYPLLRRMEEAGYLRREQRVVEGRARKYYTATAEGRRVLAEARARIEELVEEVLAEASPIEAAPS